MRAGSAHRKYDFNYKGNRMLDTWWQKNNPDKRFTQSLRCYSPMDLMLLLEGTGLKLADIKPGGALNYDTLEYKDSVPLGESMSYMVKLVRY
ncbi:hypothetical protein [Oceanobacillus damuensis]|uniref:hypothetical protein n=1 Tax=Oceanobacillus damuensis TaxID=937928 RepID=UPI00082F9285|nr:hypothetical protein [Oceanobacillus damuensis]